MSARQGVGFLALASFVALLVVWITLKNPDAGVGLGRTDLAPAYTMEEVCEASSPAADYVPCGWGSKGACVSGVCECNSTSWTHDVAPARRRNCGMPTFVPAWTAATLLALALVAPRASRQDATGSSKSSGEKRKQRQQRNKMGIVAFYVLSSVFWTLHVALPDQPALYPLFVILFGLATAADVTFFATQFFLLRRKIVKGESTPVLGENESTIIMGYATISAALVAVGVFLDAYPVAANACLAAALLLGAGTCAGLCFNIYNIVEYEAAKNNLPGTPAAKFLRARAMPFLTRSMLETVAVLIGIPLYATRTPGMWTVLCLHCVSAVWQITAREAAPPPKERPMPTPVPVAAPPPQSEPPQLPIPLATSFWQPPPAPTLRPGSGPVVSAPQTRSSDEYAAAFGLARMPRGPQVEPPRVPSGDRRMPPKFTAYSPKPSVADDPTTNPQTVGSVVLGDPNDAWLQFAGNVDF